MSPGLFAAQLNDIELLLKRLGLLKERNLFPKYSHFGLKDFKHLGYREVWEKCYKEQLYDFLLTDFALLQFRYDESDNGLSFAFYEAPLETFTYEDYLVNEIGFQPEEIDQIGDVFRDDYELALQHSDFKAAFTPLRYDFDPENYIMNRHPAAHMHFGFKNNIRLCTVKLLRPTSFLMFVLRQHYPDKWIEFINFDRSKTLIGQVRDALDDVDATFLGERDYWEMILS